MFERNFENIGTTCIMGNALNGNSTEVLMIEISWYCENYWHKVSRHDSGERVERESGHTKGGPRGDRVTTRVELGPCKFIMCLDDFLSDRFSSVDKRKIRGKRKIISSEHLRGFSFVSSLNFDYHAYHLERLAGAPASSIYPNVPCFVSLPWSDVSVSTQFREKGVCVSCTREVVLDTTEHVHSCKY
jgi:hypothetical protein